MQEEVKQKRNSFGRKIIDIKLNIDTFIHLFCFISVLFIGADIFGVNIGFNFRIDQVFLCIFCVLLIFKDGFRITKNKWILAFAFFPLISVFFSTDIMRGIFYYCLILYNIFFIFYGFANYIRVYDLKTFIKIFRYTCYVQFAIFMLQVALKMFFGYTLPFLRDYGSYGGVFRFCLWFYEPSYMVTYFIIWFTVALYMFLVCGRASYVFDALCCLVMIVLSTSTSGFIGLALSVMLVYSVWLFRGINWKKIAVLFLFLLIIGFGILLFRDIFDVFIMRLFNTSLDAASGGRISLWKETFQVFTENPMFGVGPGNYGLYLGKDAGEVPSNVTLELMATLGIFSTIAFYGLTISLCVKAFKIRKKVRTLNSELLFACALALLIFTVVLQINQGYVRLYHWMLFGIMQGAITNQASANA